MIKKLTTTNENIIEIRLIMYTIVYKLLPFIVPMDTEKYIAVSFIIFRKTKSSLYFYVYPLRIFQNTFLSNSSTIQSKKQILLPRTVSRKQSSEVYIADTPHTTRY